MVSGLYRYSGTKCMGLRLARGAGAQDLVALRLELAEALGAPMSDSVSERSYQRFQALADLVPPAPKSGVAAIRLSASTASPGARREASESSEQSAYASRGTADVTGAPGRLAAGNARSDGAPGVRRCARSAGAARARGSAATPRAAVGCTTSARGGPPSRRNRTSACAASARTARGSRVAARGSGTASGSRIAARGSRVAARAATTTAGSGILRRELPPVEVE